MPTTNSIKWFKNGRFGDLGYAAPYIAKDKFYSNNQSLLSLANKAGELIFSIMHQPDVLISTPPKKYFLKALGKAIDRLRTIVAAETTPEGTTENRTVGVSPTPEAFLIYPIPYWRIRNRWIKRWASYMLFGIGEVMKHQDNVFSLSMHSDVTGILSMYADMIYQQIAIEFLKKDPAAAKVPGFQILDADYDAYTPDSVFLMSERVDTGAPITWNISTEDLAPLAQGIPAPIIYPMLADWPIDFVDPDTGIGADPSQPFGTLGAGSSGTGVGASSAQAAAAVVSAPGP